VTNAKAGNELCTHKHANLAILLRKESQDVKVLFNLASIIQSTRIY